MKIPQLAQELERMAQVKFLEYRGQPTYALKAFVEERLAPDKVRGILPFFKDTLNEILWWRASSRQRQSQFMFHACLKNLEQKGYFKQNPNIQFKSIRNKLGLRRMPGLFLRSMVGKTEGNIIISSEKNAEFVLSNQFTRGKDKSTENRHALNAYALVAVVMHEATHAKIFQEGIVFQSPLLDEKTIKLMNNWMAPYQTGSLQKFYHEMMADTYASMILLKESQFDPMAWEACQALLSMREKGSSSWLMKKLEKKGTALDPHTTQLVLKKVLEEKDAWKDLSPDALFSKAQEYATNGMLEIISPYEEKRNGVPLLKRGTRFQMLGSSLPASKDVVTMLLLKELSEKPHAPTSNLETGEDPGNIPMLDLACKGYEIVREPLLKAINPKDIVRLQEKDLLTMLVGALGLYVCVAKTLKDPLYKDKFEKAMDDFAFDKLACEGMIDNGIQKYHEKIRNGGTVSTEKPNYTEENVGIVVKPFSR